ncbi:MAG: histidine phosphatase family protein [Verrucomicrobia bacterium]|nr:histidine phosphatase family protein [Verrucomicrobiota bacterium]
MEKLHKKIYLVRHGETEWSKGGRHTGLTDIPLTERGKEEACLAGKRLKGETFASVLVSPLQRAQQTCHLCGFEGEISPDLVEWDYGLYEGLTTAQIRREVPHWTIFTHGAQGGESLEAIEKRAQRVISKILDIQGDVAIFSHGHFLRALAAVWIEMGVRGGGRLFLETAAISILGWEKETRALLLWNDTAHLV